MRSIPHLLAACMLITSAPAFAQPQASPLSFFEGRTVSEGTTKVLLKKRYKDRAQGIGRIEPDGTLVLVQQVEEGGQPRKERRWRIRQVAPNRFSGTMTEASGPVIVERIGERYRFRFRMKNGLAVEQWITLMAGGNSARSTVTVRKLGIKVATGEALIRRLSPLPAR
jgi:hypothetical protein